MLTKRDDSGVLTYDYVKEIYAMNSSVIATSDSTRDKLLWFRHKIDENTVPFTEGYNEIIINRETLLEDSIH